MTPVLILLKATLVLLAAATANAALGRRGSAAARHLILALAVVALLLLPIFSSLLPGWTVIRGSAGSSVAEAVRLFESAGSGLVDGDAVERPPHAAEPMSSARQAPMTRGMHIRWPAALLLVYASGVVLLLVRAGAQWLSIRRLTSRAQHVADPAWTRLLQECAARLGMRKPARLLRTVEHTMPLAAGTLNGAILVPAAADAWSEDRRRAVLLHELAHVARYDILTQMLAAVVCAFYWIHPGAWWLARRLRVERELACDDRVLSAGVGARDYGRHLLELAHREIAPATTVGMAGTRELERRLRAMLDVQRSRMAPTLSGRVAAVAVTIALLLPVSTATARVDATDEEPARIGRHADLRDRPASDSPDGHQRRRAGQGPFGQAPGAFPQAGAIPPGDERLLGLWELRPSTAGVVQLRLCYAELFARADVAVEQLEGLSAAGFPVGAGPIRFGLRRDAGTFVFDGTVEGETGAGTYAFEPSAGFAAAVEARGFDRPTPSEQLALAQHGIGLARLDEMSLQAPSSRDVSWVVRYTQSRARLEELMAAVAAPPTSRGWC